MWNQVYNPLGNAALSTLVAALPVVTLLVLIASGKVKAHWAALIALLVAILVAVFLFTMPGGLAIRASILGAVTGFFPIGWIVLNVIFMYRLTVEKGAFETLQQTIGGVTTDRRLQLLLIAFSFGAFFEGASGFGTPVAVTGAILIGLGFSPLAAADHADDAGPAEPGHHLVAAECLELVGNARRGAVHFIEKLRMRVEIMPPAGDLVLHGGDAIDDGHRACSRRPGRPPMRRSRFGGKRPTPRSRRTSRS